jgi:hypothetical protein
MEFDYSHTMKTVRAFQSLILAAIPLAFLLPSATAQEASPSISVSATDKTAASEVTSAPKHALGLSSVNRKALWASGKPQTLSSAVTTLPIIPPPGFYPGDLSNPGGGPTVQTAASHNLYVNCAPSCWGYPGVFQNNLNHSDMIHITDQYTGTSANNRYTVGTSGLVVGSFPPILYDADIYAIAHAGATIFGNGYHEIYHIFLPPGQDVCFTGSSPLECYSPDNLTTFYFCAYHGSVDFSDIGHVLFTVEPYQNVNGCNVVQPSPNGGLIDSTADVLSHETFETITDPDIDAWYNYFALDLLGAEIGDECQDFDFGYGKVSLNGKNYEIQPEYSNSQHGCAFSPYVTP